MSLTPEMCAFIQQTARSFKTGAPRRRYMAQTLEAFGLSQCAASAVSAGDATRSAERFTNAVAAYCHGNRSLHGV